MVVPASYASNPDCSVRLPVRLPVRTPRFFTDKNGIFFYRNCLLIILPIMSTRCASSSASSSSMEMSAKRTKTEHAVHTSSPLKGGGASSGSEDEIDHFEQAKAAAMQPDYDHPSETQESGPPVTPVPALWLEKAFERVNTLKNPDDILGALCAHYGMSQDHPIRKVMRSFLNEAFSAFDDDSDIQPHLIFQIGSLTQRRFPMEADAEMNLAMLFQALRRKRAELDSLLHKLMSAHYNLRNTSTLKGQVLAFTAQMRYAVAPPPSKLEFERTIKDHINSLLVDAQVFTLYMQDFRPFMTKEESA
jgi:hypothetical protein